MTESARETVCVATPSRGLVHSRTIEAVHRALFHCGELEWAGWVLTHDLPIPECHETVCELALATGATYIWLVEEDVVPPENALPLMLSAMREKRAIGAFIDYPIGHAPVWNCAALVGDEIVWCGVGCLLLRREAFERLPRPWFARMDEVEVRRVGDEIRIRTFSKPYQYGGQDIHFTLRLWQAGLRIAYVPPQIAMCDHLYLETWGHRMTNAGTHRVTKRPAPERWIEV